MADCSVPLDGYRHASAGVDTDEIAALPCREAIGDEPVDQIPSEMSRLTALACCWARSAIIPRDEAKGSVAGEDAGLAGARLFFTQIPPFGDCHPAALTPEPGPVLALSAKHFR